MSNAAAGFRAGVEAKDLEAMAATLADDVRLLSPVAFRPYEGKEAVTGLLGVVLRTFETFRYVGELAGQVETDRDGTATDTDILVFRATVQGKEIHGLDMLHLGEAGLIDELTVMVRPLSAVQTLGAAVLQGLVDAGISPAAAS